MRPDARDPGYVWHIEQALQKVVEYMEGKTLDDLLSDELLQDGIIRRFTVAGEAAGRISAATREAHPEVPWRQVVGLRNVVVHQYDKVDLAALWQIVTEEVPPVLDKIRHLREDLSREEGI